MNNVVDYAFRLFDESLLNRDETTELVAMARACRSIDEVMDLPISDPQDFLSE